MNTNTQSDIYSTETLAGMGRKWFNREFQIDEKYRPLATGFIYSFAFLYALGFPGWMQYVAYLGPGLGDDWNMGPFLQLFRDAWNMAGGEWFHPLFLGLVVLVAANMVFTAAVIVFSYTMYPKIMGKSYPITMLFTYFGLTLVCTTGIGVMYLLIGLFATAMGYDLISGINAMGSLLNQLRTWAQQVPTLVDMPAWMAFFVLNMVGGFFHYWFHRLSHESRLLWLLFHRTHHMTPELIQPATQAVFNSFPFFIIAAVPYVVIFSVVGKLITSESLVTYLIVFKLFSAFANMWSHQTALYEWAQGKWIIRLLSTITSEGVYHYLHHSRDAEHNESRGNLVNIGGGLFFFWDKVFGTYRPVTSHRPNVGLQGIEPEAMTTNPLRLAFAGISQLVYELVGNKDWKARFLVLVGPSDYVPAVSQDFVLKHK